MAGRIIVSFLIIPAARARKKENAAGGKKDSYCLRRFPFAAFPQIPSGCVQPRARMDYFLFCRFFHTAAAAAAAITTTATGTAGKLFSGCAEGAALSAASALTVSSLLWDSAASPLSSSTGSQLPSDRKVKTGCSRNSSTVIPNPE